MNREAELDLHAKSVWIAYKFVPLPSGCSNCWGDLGEGCSDECRQSSADHSKKIDEAAALIDRLVIEGQEKSAEAPNSVSLSRKLEPNLDYSTVFDTLKDYALKLVANAHGEMTDEQWEEWVNEHTAVYAKALTSGSDLASTDPDTKNSPSNPPQAVERNQ